MEAHVLQFFYVVSRRNVFNNHIATPATTHLVVLHVVSFSLSSHMFSVLLISQSGLQFFYVVSHLGITAAGMTPIDKVYWLVVLLCCFASRLISSMLIPSFRATSVNLQFFYVVSFSGVCTCTVAVRRGSTLQFFYVVSRSSLRASCSASLSAVKNLQFFYVVSVHPQQCIPDVAECNKPQHLVVLLCCFGQCGAGLPIASSTRYLLYTCSSSMLFHEKLYLAARQQHVCGEQLLLQFFYVVSLGINIDEIRREAQRASLQFFYVVSGVPRGGSTSQRSPP